MPDDLVRIQLKRPFRDGTYAVDMDPLSLLCRLATSVPPPRQHTVRYAGVLAAASKWRALVVPPPPPEAPAQAPAPMDGNAPAPPTHRCRYRPWSELLQRTFAIDLDTCARCGGELVGGDPARQGPRGHRQVPPSPRRADRASAPVTGPRASRAAYSGAGHPTKASSSTRSARADSPPQRARRPSPRRAPASPNVRRTPAYGRNCFRTPSKPSSASLTPYGPSCHSTF
jgi:hypothetical protein